MDLTEREREVMDALVAGKFQKEIAYERGVSTQTVSTQAQRAMEKLGARTVLQAAVIYSRSD
jgi:DNA-binding NarL/FixJ family response regulator